MTPAELRRIAEAATKGPWEARADDADMLHVVRDSEYLSYVCTVGGKEAPNAEADAEFIATFNPQRVLELLDQIEQLQAVVRDQHDNCTYQTRLAAVEEVHERREYWTETGEDICDTCSRRKQGDFVYWPCDTIKAVRGE